MKVGSLVELVDDTWSYSNGAKIYPVKGKIYTVRELFMGSSGNPGLRLEEIINPLVGYHFGIKEPGFRCYRFRELMPPTSISIDEILEQEITT